MTRLERRAAWSKRLRRSFVERGETTYSVAKQTGYTQTEVCRWINADERAAMPAPVMETIQSAIARDMLDYGAGKHGLVVVPLPSATSEKDLLQLLSLLNRECGEAQAVYASSIANGLTPLEKAAINREAREAIAVLAALVKLTEAGR